MYAHVMFIAELHCVHNPVIVLGQVATKWSRIRMESRKENHGWCFHQNWLVVYLSLWKNMKVSWGYYSQHMETNKMSQTTNQVLTFDKQKQLRQVFPTTCWCHIYYGVSLKEQNRAGIPSVWMLPPTTARVFFFFAGFLESTWKIQLDIVHLGMMKFPIYGKS